MIRIGVGGWTFEPWRGTFYPEGLAQKRELEWASRQLTSIEVNGTFYGAQKPESFRRWAGETPDDFVFSLKGPRFATNRGRLAEAGPSVERFVNGGMLELGDKLGPILWQLPATKRFDEEDMAAFLALLPREAEGRRLRHVVEPRHDSFIEPAFIALMRRFETPIVYADSDTYPDLPDVTGDFVYARLQRSVEEEPAGYAPGVLDAWAERFQRWAEGGAPADLALVDKGAPALDAAGGRDCFVYVISGAKVRAPAAAMALIERLKG